MPRNLSGAELASLLERRYRYVLVRQRGSHLRLESDYMGSPHRISVPPHAPRFWQRFQELPDSVQQTARRNFELLEANPRHPSLRFRNVGRYWSARVGAVYRAVAVQDGDDFVWFWIGAHDEYLQVIGR